MDEKTIKNIVEAALFAAGRPMAMNELLRLFSEDERPERKAMRKIIAELVAEYDERGIELIEVASGYRIQVRQQMGEWLSRLAERKPPRYSRASMETLALIAYRQPITRGDIEDVRGVSVSTNIIRTLLERGWIRIVGHRDVPGRPAMFGTTKEFLDYFNLKTLDELPSLAELQDIDSVNAELDFGDPQEASAGDGEATLDDAGVETDAADEADSDEFVDDEWSDAADDATDELDDEDADDDDEDDDDFDGWHVDDEEESDSASGAESLSA